MMVGPAIGRDEASALEASARRQSALRDRPARDIDRAVPPLTMHFQPLDGGMFLSFPKLLRAGLLRRLDP